MRALRIFLFALTIIFLKIGTLQAQSCEFWSEPRSVSDSVTDNRNAIIVTIPIDYSSYYVFWERSSEALGSEIVYLNYYEMGEPQTVVAGNGYNVTNPQVISMLDWYPPTDTLAYIFYQIDEPGNEDIYFVVMTNTGFTGPSSFATSLLDESHLRVSPGGGIVWQEGDNIRFCRLKQDNSGFYFEQVISIDEGACRNPDIQNADLYSGEQYIAWEKGIQDNPDIWYSFWSYDNDEWSEPFLLFEGGFHSDIRFSKGIDFSSWVPLLLSDLIDSTGQYHISGYDFYGQDEFISEFTQSITFQPDLFTIDLITQDYWETGFLSFKHDEGDNNSDIFSSDYGILRPELYNYCRIDNSPLQDIHPQLFQGAWGFDYFDLICIWESWRNGHWQLFSSTTPVVIGNVPENGHEGDLIVRAYPNPCSGFLWLESESGRTSDLLITMYNNFGQLVKTIDEKFSSAGKKIKKIETGDLPAGVYLVKVETGNSTCSLKVVKM